MQNLWFNPPHFSHLNTIQEALKRCMKFKLKGSKNGSMEMDFTANFLRLSTWCSRKFGKEFSFICCGLLVNVGRVPFISPKSGIPTPLEHSFKIIISQNWGGILHSNTSSWVTLKITLLADWYHMMPMSLEYRIANKGSAVAFQIHYVKGHWIFGPNSWVGPLTSPFTKLTFNHGLQMMRKYMGAILYLTSHEPGLQGASIGWSYWTITDDARCILS